MVRQCCTLRRPKGSTWGEPYLRLATNACKVDGSSPDSELLHTSKVLEILQFPTPSTARH